MLTKNFLKELDIKLHHLLPVNFIITGSSMAEISVYFTRNVDNRGAIDHILRSQGIASHWDRTLDNELEIELQGTVEYCRES